MTFQYCEAQIRIGRGFSLTGCSKEAKHEVTVRPFTYGSDETTILTVHVCGTHKNVLERGGSFSVSGHGPKTIAVEGIRTDLRKLEKDLKWAEHGARTRSDNRKYSDMSLGRWVYGHVDELLDAVPEAHPIREGFVQAIAERRETDAEVAAAWEKVRDLEAQIKALKAGS